MSLLKWKELAKSKTKLGNKINYVHNAIKQRKIGEETSESSFEKVFKPVTSKLNNAIISNLKIPKKRPPKKMEVPDYEIDKVEDIEDMNLNYFFGDDEQTVPPQQEKQMAPEPPEYEEKPPEYNYEEVDYGIADEDLTRDRLDDLELSNYENNEELINDPEIGINSKIIQINMLIKKAKKDKHRLNGFKAHVTKQYKRGDINEAVRQLKNKKIDDERAILKEYVDFNERLLKELKNEKKMSEVKKEIKGAIEYKGSGIKGRGKIKKVEKERNRIKGYKAYVTKKYNGGAISEAERQIMNKRLDNKMAVFNEYIKDHKKKLELKKKIKGRVRRQRGGNVIFFNDPKQLLNKLELIIGETIAGNTSIKMRNMGVTILDTLLRMSTVNRPQYNKLYNLYFKV